MDEQQEKTFRIIQLGILSAAVVLSGLIIGGTTYYVLNSNFQKERETNEKALNASQEQVIELIEKKTPTKETNSINASTNTVPINTTSVATRPTVSAVGTINKSANEWVFSFSESVDKSTVKVGNINLYSVGGSVGTQGRKDLANDVLANFGLDYSSSASTLHIPITNKNYLECASCTWELEFTDKIKGLNQNSLVQKSFNIQ